jgi:hypothetical protein
VLQAYSRRNLSIGYVQGFNFIVGRLLKITHNEEDVFWLFAQIIENILPINYYSEMAGLMVDIDIVMSLMNAYFPELVYYMEENFFIEYFKNIVIQWFISMFINNFNENVLLTLWDVLFLDGNIVLFKSVIGLIKLVKNDIMNITSLEAFKNYIKGYFAGFKDVSHLNHVLILRKFEFNNEMIDRYRTIIEGSILNHINELNKEKLKKLKENLQKINAECQEIWPICVFDAESNYHVIDFQIYRGIEGPVIYDDYMEDKNLKLKKMKKKTNYIDFENVLIERKFHCCGKLMKQRIKATSEFTTIETDDSNNLSTDDSKSNRSVVDTSYFGETSIIPMNLNKDDSIVSNSGSNSSSATKSNFIITFSGFKAKHQKCLSTVSYSQFVKPSKDAKEYNNDFFNFISELRSQCIYTLTL